MSTIGQKTVEAVANKFRALLVEHKADLDKAWLKCDKTLSVPVSLKFKSGPGSGDIEYSVSLEIVTDRVKTSGSGVVNERQDELFPREKEKAGPAPVYIHRERGNIPSHWWPPMPDCRLDIYKEQNRQALNQPDEVSP